MRDACIHFDIGHVDFSPMDTDNVDRLFVPFGEFIAALESLSSHRNSLSWVYTPPAYRNSEHPNSNDSGSNIVSVAPIRKVPIIGALDQVDVIIGEIMEVKPDSAIRITRGRSVRRE